MTGLLTFLDPPREDTAHREDNTAHREDTAQTIRMEIAMGVETARVRDLCKGDVKDGAVSIIGAVQIIASAEALSLLDKETKLLDKETTQEPVNLIVKCLRELGYRVGLYGVNDLPALKRADVGIAVFDDTDAVKTAADIILTMQI